MERLKKALILLLVAGIPAAAPPFFASPHNLCFTSGSITYRLASSDPRPDFRVKITTTPADLRIALVDGVEAADFALVDDVSVDASACRSAGNIKTIAVVDDNSPADLAINVSRADGDADMKLFVHSARFGQRDAAALMAAMRHYQTTRLALSR